MKIFEIKDAGVAKAAEEAAGVLRAGGIVLYPTDTVYGLAVDALNKEAVLKLQKLKGRDASKAISIVVRDREMAERYVRVSDKAVQLFDKFLPGPLTLVLPTINNELSSLSNNGTIGVRIPKNKFTQELSKVFENPYTTTSANLSGKPTLSTVEEIIKQLGEFSELIDVVIDDGVLGGNKPSTVVKISGENIEILREGALSKEDLEI